jgi:hypothetical protein
MTVQIFSWQNPRVSNRNLLNLRNLRNLWLNPFSVFGFKVQTEMVRLHRTALVRCASLILTPMGFNPGKRVPSGRKKAHSATSPGFLAQMR